MFRRAIIVFLTLGAVTALAGEVFSRCTQADGLQLVLTPRVWAWAVLFDGHAMLFVLQSRDSVEPSQVRGKSPERVRRLTLGELWCYHTNADMAPPLRGIAWWLFDFSFPDTMLQTNPDTGVACRQPVSLPGKIIHAHHIGFRLWPCFLLFAAYPTIAFIRGPLRRWRRQRKGLCVKCGYNLSGNVTGACPECGTEVDTAKCSAPRTKA